jgi:hypothetical protein
MCSDSEDNMTVSKETTCTAVEDKMTVSKGTTCTAVEDKMTVSKGTTCTAVEDKMTVSKGTTCTAVEDKMTVSKGTTCTVPEDRMTLSIPKTTTEITTKNTSKNTTYAASAYRVRKGFGEVQDFTEDDVEAIANTFIELRQNGKTLTEQDYSGIRKVLENGVEVKDALKWLKDCFKQRKPKDGIGSFTYCVLYILDRHIESMKSLDERMAQVKKMYNEEDFDLDD